MLILTVHGLGGTSSSHYFMKKYLETYFIINEPVKIESIDYASKTVDFAEAVKVVEKYLDIYSWINENEQAILIGHSLGGMIIVNVNHPRVKGVVTISSPHTGCAFAEFVNTYAPAFFSNFAFGKMYDHLVSSANTSHVPKIICITSSLFPYYAFDGRVYTEEMVHPQAYKTMHLDYSDHILQLYDIRMFGLIYDAVVDLTNINKDNRV